MKVAALYDIHGNIEALEAVLDDPRLAEADAVLIGGDVVPGPFAAECLARLEALALPQHWLRGNGERDVARTANEQIDPDDLSDEEFLEKTWALSAAELGPAESERLADLPLTLELDGVFYCHASPRRDDEFLTRISPNSRYQAALADVSAPVVVAGHTHQQHSRQLDRVLYVNAGSVGLPYEGDASARWLWVEDGQPEPCSTNYDGAGAGQRILDTGWPDVRSINGGLIDPIDPAQITQIFEEMVA